jgi:hypothetical protein
MGKLAGLPVMMLGAALFFATQANAAVLTVESKDAAPGSQVTINVILATSQGEEVAGTQNDITFDPAVVSVAAASACVINPAISDRADGCEDDPNSGPCKQLNRALDDVEGGMKRFRGLILSLANTTTIPDGVLYTCTFQVAQDATEGDVFPLACSNEGASDPDGAAITPISCTSGQIRIAPPVVPTATATSTTVVTVPTNTPTTGGTPPTATRTNTRPGGGGGSSDDDGCQVVAPISGHASWLLFAPAALLLWTRRRSR